MTHANLASIIILSPDTAKSLLWLLAMLLADYTAVIAAIFIDLRSGTLKARREGRPRTSSGYRRTVEKASRYFITLFALTVIDTLIICAAMLFRSTMGWAVPVFPLFTSLGAIALALIEGKSVMENSQRRADFSSAAASARDLLTDADLRSLIAAISRLRAEHSDPKPPANPA